MLPSGNCITRPASSFRALFIAAASLFLGAVSLQAQHVHYGSFHKHSQAQPQTFSGNAKLRAQFAAARKSSLSLAVADLNEDGTRDLVSGYASGATGVLSVQLGDSNAVAPSTPDALAAHQRGEFRAPFSATATLTSVPVHPDLLKIADVNGDGHLDAIVAAQGGSAIYVLFGDGQGNFAPAVPLPVSGAISSLTTWRAPGAKFDSIAAGLCTDAAHCFVNIYSSDGTTLASVAVTGTPTALEVAYLNETATRDIAIVSGTDLLLLDGATALTAPHLENLPVHNAVAIAAGQFVYDRRGLLQLAVLTADGSLHILARPGIDAHALTHTDLLASRRDILGTHVSPYHVNDPASLGWTDAETLQNVAQISSQPGAKTILLRGRFTGNGGDGLIVISNGQITRVSHSAISDGATEPMMVTSSSVDIEPADDTTAAVAAPVTPSAVEGLISFGPSISFQPLISMPSRSNLYFVTTTADRSDNLSTVGLCVTVPNCSLRDAIGLVNQDAALNIAGNQMDEIDFELDGTYTLSLNPGTNFNGDPSFHLEIGGPVNIVGNGSSRTVITANNNDKVFSINSGATDSGVLQPYDVFISGVTLENGTNNNNPASGFFDNFGGILDWEADGTGFLTISNSILTGGNAQWGPGGGIGATNSAAGTGTLELDSSTVSSSQTPEIGGGISMGPGGALVLSGTTISSNNAKATVNSSDTSALGQGGGLFLGSRGSGAQTTITGGSITGNQSTSDGGGIWTGTGINMTGTSITGNTSGGYGGGLFHNTIGETTALSGLTFTTNTAGTDGGAIAVGSSAIASVLTMLYSRIHGNTAIGGGHAGISVGNGTTGGVATVIDNWWGCNLTDNILNFTGTGCDTGAVLGGGTLTVSPYAALSLNLSSATPIYNTTFTATGDLAHDSLGAALGPGNLAAYAGLPAKIVIQQNSGSPVTLNGTLDSGASATESTTLTIPGTGTAKITVDGTTITKSFNVLAPDLTVTSTHTGNFHPGDTGDTYTLTATNSGTSVTTASVVVADTLPSGFNATSISSTNPHWVCTLIPLSCSNVVDTAAAGASFTPITVTFSVGTNVAGSFNNSVAVSGGGEPPIDTGNDTGTDTTLVIAPPLAAIVFNPVTTPLNSTSSLQFTLTNPSGNTVALTGVAFSLTLPTGLTVATTSTTPCSGTLTTTAGTGVISLTGATIAIGGTCTYNVTVTGATAGIYSVSTGTPSSTNGGTGVAAANAALTVAAPPTVLTSFGAPTIPLNVNAATTLSFIISNPNTTVSLSGIAFTDTLPAGLIVATPNGLSSTCGGTATAIAGSSSIVLAAGTLAASSNCIITVNITGTTAGVKNNSVTVASTEGGSALVSNASITVVAPATISKSFGAPTIPLNGSTSLTFIVSNPNTSVALSGVSFTDNLPAGLQVSAPNGLSGSCGTGTITAVPTGSTIQLTGALIPPSTNCIFFVNVKGVTAGVQNNVTGTVLSVEGGIGLTASASTTVVAPPTIAAAFSPATIAVGSTSTLTFTVTNPSTTVALTGIAFLETLPASLPVANGSSTVCGGTLTTVAPTGIFFSGGSLAANGSCQIAVTVTGGVAGVYTTTSGTVSSTNGGTGLTASANLTVVSPPTVSTGFGAPTIPLNVNAAAALSFIITNTNATVSLSGVAFTDTLPSGLVVATPSGASSNCNGTLTATAGSGSITLSAGTLAVSGNCIISVNVTGTTAGVKNNSVTVASNEGGSSTVSNASITVVAPATISKAFGAPTIPLNGATSLTFTLTNPSTTVGLSGVTFTDNLPAGLNVATPNGLSGVCGTGTITAVPGSSAIQLAGGTIAATANCIFSVNVKGVAAGVQNNVTTTVLSTEGGIGLTASASTTVVAPPTISAAFSPAPIAVTGTSTLTFTLTNPNTANALTGLAFTETLPTGLTIATGTNSVCGGTLTTTSPTSISFASGTLAASSNCTIPVTVTGAVAGIYSAVSGAITSTNGGTGLTSTAALTVVAPPTVVTAFGAATIPLNVNAATALTITITNPNTTVAFTGLSFTDTLPSGLVVATPNGVSNTCNGTPTATAGSGSISLSAGTLAVSASCTITVNVTGTTAGVKNNSVTVASTEGGNATASNASVTVVAPATLAASFGAATIPLNGTTTATFIIGNPSTTVALTGIGFTDAFPTGLVIATPPGITGNCAGANFSGTAGTSTVTFTGGTLALAAGSTCTVSVNVTGTTAGVKSNSTSAPTSTNGGTGTAATSSITVVAPPTLAAAFSPAQVAVNGTSVLTFTITDPNTTVGLTGVAFTLTLPTGLIVGTPNGLATNGNCGAPSITSTAGTSLISFSNGSVSNGSNCSFNVNVTGATAGVYTATSSTITSTNGGTGLTASAGFTVANPPTVATAFGASTIPLNGSTSLTITITNPNTAVALSGLAFTDTLPTGLNIATPNGVNNTCGGSPSAPAGTSTILLSAGTLAASASCTITVNVTGTTAGMKNNSVVVASTEGGNAAASNASVIVVAPPALSESFGAPTIPLNGSTTLVFTITNPNLNASLSGMGFTDTLPTGLVLGATPIVGSNCVGTPTAVEGSSSISFSGGSLTAASPCSITFNVTGTTAGVKTNLTSVITSNEGGSGTAATASVTVVAPPTLALSFASGTIAVNGTTTLTFSINNPNSTVTLHGISFTLTLPAGLSTGNVAGSSLCGGTVSVTSNSVISFTGNSNNFTPGSGCGFIVNVTGNTAGAYTVTSSAITSTEGGTGVTASANLSVASPPVTAASFGAAAIPLNGSTTFTIQINNPNSVLGLTGVAFTDTLSGGLVIASTPALSNSCNGTATATAGSHTITLSGGTLAASATCTITVSVTGTLPNAQGTTVTVTSNEGGAGTGANASITVVAPPSFVASFGSTAVLVGNSTTLNFTIINPNGGSTALTGIGFTGTLPSGLVIATPNGVVNTCGTLTATAGTSSISFSNGSLGPAATCNFSINVTGTTAGLKNFVTSNPTSNEGGSGTVGASSIQVAATFQAAPATTVGQSNTFTVTTVTATQPVSYSVNTQGATGLDFTLAGSPAPSCVGNNPFVCTVTITFSPKAPGLREGVLLPLDGSSAVLQTVFLSGVGNGPVAVFDQNVQATLVTPVNLPAGAVFDAAGNYYYAETGAQRVSKRTPGGVTTVIDNTGLTAPTSVAVDGAGTAYIANSASTVFIIPAGSTCAASATCATYTGFLTATGVAVDGKGNLYVADKANANITVINIATGVKTTLSAAPLQTHIYDVAVDAAGNLYTADVTGSSVGKFTGATGTIALVSSAFAGPYSIRTDAANNLYVVDQGGSAGTGRLSFLPAGSSTPQTITVTGTLQPNGVAINAAGTLYVPVSESVLSGSANDNIVTLARNGDSFTVATGTPITTKSATQTATVTNIGNAPLVVSSVTPNAVSAVDAAVTPACTGSIAINASCKIGAQLAPTVVGPTSGVITLASNTLASPQTVSISGTAVPDTVKLAFGTAPATPITAGGNAGSAITVLEEDVNSATVTSAADSVALSVTYPDNSVHPLGSVTAVNGVATFNLSATALTLSGSYHYTASFGTLTSALATEVVNPAATSHFTVTSTTAAVVGVAFNATVTALDQFNNIATAYAGTVHLTSSDTTATLPANYTFVAGDAGVHILAVQLNTAGTQSVTATDTVTGSITGSQTGIVVGKRSTGTVVTAVPTNTSIFGVPITVTGTVSPSAAGPVNAGGTIQFADNSTNFGSPVALGSGTASIVIPAPTTGSHSYSAAYTGDANFTASNSATALSFTVNKAASSVTLISSSTNAGTGVPVTFTATVSDATVGSTGNPTGSVQFFNTVNSITTPLGAVVPLTGNTATLTISFAAVASNSITAVYSGDGNFTTNTSAAVGVTTLTPGYTAVANPSTLNIAQGSSGTSVLTLTPFGNYTGTAQFSCTGLPPFSSCQFIPSSVTFTGNNAVQTVQMTVFTLDAHTVPGAPTQNLLWFPAAGMLALLIAIRRRKLARTLRPLLMLAIAALALTAITGCGSSSSFITPKGTTVVSVHVGATAAPGSSSGNVNQTATITINIQ